MRHLELIQMQRDSNLMLLHTEVDHPHHLPFYLTIGFSSCGELY